MSFKKILSYKNTLLFRLTLLYALIFIVSTSITFAVFYGRIYTVAMSEIHEELTDEIDALKKVMAKEGQEAIVDAIADEAKTDPEDDDYYRLINKNGVTLAAAYTSAWASVPTIAYSELSEKEEQRLYTTIEIDGDDTEAIIMSAIIGPDQILQIGESLEEVYEYLEIFRNLFMILFSVLLLLSILMGWFIANRAVVEVDGVTKTAQQISDGHLNERVAISSRFDEIKRLGGTFNEMIDRIQILLKSMKDINDNIAHDLRSPLARIRGIAEMTLIKENSAGDYKEMAINTIEECDNLINMVNTMLDITEAEAGVSLIKQEKIDIVVMVREACDLFDPIAKEKNITLQHDLKDPITLIGDRNKLQRVVTNLIENAIKYTPSSGTVRIIGRFRPDKVQILFQDTGIGIPEGDLPHIFERFYRCDRSRPHGGVGLGLSLAKAYTEAMNGLITVTSEINKGSTFKLQFSP